MPANPIPKKLALSKPTQKKPVCRAARTVANVATKTRSRMDAERSKHTALKPGARPAAGRVLIPIKDAAQRIGLSVWTLRSWVYAGRVNFHRIGPAGRVLISDAEIERIIRESEVAATAA